jgi:thioredoxin:protein disulfide reductase
VRTKLKRCFFQVLVLCALVLGTSLVRAQLAPNEAFATKLLSRSATKVVVQFSVAPGHFLYAERFEVAASAPRPGAQTAKITERPTGKRAYEPAFSEMMTYVSGTAQLVISAPAMQAIVVTYQGCWEGGICYPPQELVLPGGAF